MAELSKDTQGFAASAAQMPGQGVLLYVAAG